MKSTNSPIDPLPDEFTSDEEAAEFWDTHSLTDYEDFLEPVSLEAKIERRHFEIEVDEQSFLAVRKTAEKQRKPVKELASEIIKRELATA